ncbi:MAG: DUF4446 family protein [Clostridia bacterium]|nr:DUF4446 family protein [Clostridia bacterium]
METILNILKTDTFLIILFCGLILLFLLYLINIIKLSRINKNYKYFINKIGNGNNIQETIENYIKRIEEVQKENNDLKNYCKQLDSTLATSIQKIGLVRYNAFKDTGSDLSFTLALLNEKNTGVVLNGIYSREMSNIYAKPVENGISTYTLSEEEKQAIKKALEE